MEVSLFPDNPKIGIMGVGMVGGSVKRYFEKTGREVAVYDPAKGFTDMAPIQRSQIVFVCVPTPYEEATGGFDLSFVKAAVSSLEGSHVVVIKSTVLPGTTEALQKEFPRHAFLFNPEFLTQSSADNDMSFPDRQIIGYTKESYVLAASVLRLLPLAPFERIMPATEAEVVKYFGNTWFSTKVVFANQMYDLCRAIGVNYDVVKESAGADKRIGHSHLDVLHGGYRGYGGACLPKDTRALIQLGERLGTPMDLLKKVEEINNALVLNKEQSVPQDSLPQTSDNKTYARPIEKQE